MYDSIKNAETAYLMQQAVPELTDISKETKATRNLYGVDNKDPKHAEYARQCLMARRLVERGVRFVELSCCSHGIGGGNNPNPWDQHGDLQKGHTMMAKQVDQPVAALLADVPRQGRHQEHGAVLQVAVEELVRPHAHHEERAVHVGRDLPGAHP